MRSQHKLRQGCRRAGDWLGRQLRDHPVIFTCVLALAVTLLVEALSRHSPFAAVAFLFVHPVHFLANYFIVLATISLAHFFKRRRFFLVFFSALWAALGAVNGIMLAFRVTPFAVVDFLLLPSVKPIIRQYLEIWQLVLIALLLVGLVVWLVITFLRAPKVKPAYRTAAVFTAASVLLAVGAYSLTVVGHREKRAETFSNIANAYKTYGFVYCFSTGAVDMGIPKPEFYSRASVNWLLGNLDQTGDGDLRPNILLVQLESFFDVSRLTDITLESDPTPVFSRLKRECPSGYLTVPSIGAGTANTEFEVLSGMSLDFFGMGEYPYKTVLKEEPCESVCRDLKELGYTSTAIHNNTGTFYDRHIVFSQLGFDRFIPIEYMDGVEYNPIGWAKDQVLTGQILKALDTTPGRDFIFTITVQGHGKYQRGVDSVDVERLGVAWAGAPDDDEEDAFAYYAGQLSETDAFIGELLEALERRDEPTVVVLYGDHLPSFSIGSEQMESGDIFQTEYVLWANFPLQAEDEDVEAYQLSAKVLEDLGISRGLLTRYHQQMRDTPDYLDGLRLLEYDMLYGDLYCYGGSNPYKSTDLSMGVEPVVLDGFDYDEETGLLTARGRCFTPWSVLFLDGERLETVYDPATGLLTARVRDLASPERVGSVLTVRQMTSDGVSLGESVGLKIK